MLKSFALLMAIPTALAACQMVAPVSPPPPPIAGACGADGLQGLVGQPAQVLDTMRFSQALRILRPGMAMTMDYSAERLNIEVDGNEQIIRVSCG